MTDESEALAVPARPSATIVMLREANPHPELLLVKRRAGDAFGETYAFPGGVIDKGESAARNFCVGLSSDEANELLKLPHGGLDYYIAVIRELFEETGVLLATDRNGAWACSDALPADLRRRVDKGLMPWSDFLTQQILTLSCDSLHYFAHWETPFSEPKRWTTRFFMAQLPPGQDACHDGHETTDSCWVSASIALERREAGQMDMPYPTYKTLERMRGFRSIPELFTWAKDQRLAGVEMIRPDFKRCPDQF